MPSKNVKIDVTVLVEKLYNGGAVDECCTISDDNGGRTPTGKPEQFKSKVYKAKKVTWEATRSGENANQYDLDLVSIDFKSGTSLFSSKSLKAGANGKVVGTVESSVQVGDSESYTIKFSITAKKADTKPFEIDPDLDVEGEG